MSFQRRISLLSLSTVACLSFVGCFQQGGEPQPEIEARSLVAFGSCEDLLSYARTQIQADLERSYEQGGKGGFLPGVGTSGGAALPGMPEGPMDEGPGANDNAESDATAGADVQPKNPGASPESSSPSKDHSGTNNQEQGVDEADLVKTDGDRIFTLSQGVLRIADLRGERSTITDRVQVRKTNQYGSNEMLIHGDRILVMQTGGMLDHHPMSGQGRPGVFLYEIDASVPGQAKVVRELVVEGQYISARKTGSLIRVVLRKSTNALDIKSPWAFLNNSGVNNTVPDEPPQGMPGNPGSPQTQPGTSIPNSPGQAGAFEPRQMDFQARWEQAVAQARLHNNGVLSAMQASDLLPDYQFRDLGDPSRNSEGSLAPCEHTMRPGVESGIEMLSVLSFDLNAGLSPGESTSVMASGSTVYASTSSIYVATHPQRNSMMVDTDAVGINPGPVGVDPDEGVAMTSGGSMEPQIEARQAQIVPQNDSTTTSGRVTYIHKFDLSNALRAQYRASGQVDGELLNQFAMSEHKGILRVGATRYRKGAWQPTDSFVATLQEQGDKLQELGRVGELGKTEMIRSIRFMGDMAYVVTFRQTDPLYTVDLSVPQTPVVLGELKIEGYSAYLHPLAPGYLLGVGRDADKEGRLKGMQVSIFDVRNPQTPTRVHNYTLANASSQVEWDHRAFLHWPKTKSLVLPVRSWGVDSTTGDEQGFSGVYLLGVDAVEGIKLRAKIQHPANKGPSGIDPEALPEKATFRWTPPIERSLVVGDSLWTMSSGGLKSCSIVDGVDREWLGFR